MKARRSHLLWLLPLPLAACLLGSAGRAQANEDRERYWEERTVREFPGIGIKDSIANRKFLAAIKEKRRTDPDFFNGDDWTYRLAREIFGGLGNPGFRTLPPEPTPAPQFIVPKGPTPEAAPEPIPTPFPDSPLGFMMTPPPPPPPIKAAALVEMQAAGTDDDIAGTRIRVSGEVESVDAPSLDQKVFFVYLKGKIICQFARRPETDPSELFLRGSKVIISGLYGGMDTIGIRKGIILRECRSSSSGR